MNIAYPLPQDSRTMNTKHVPVTQLPAEGLLAERPAESVIRRIRRNTTAN